MLVGSRGAGAELTPPVLLSPQNGEILQLAAPPNQLNLQWTSVQSATGYLLIVEGPESFGDPLEALVEPPPTGNVNFNLINLETGIYSWSVTSLTATGTAPSAPSFFTVQTGTIGGGDLPAPALLLPFDSQIIRGDSALINFQWTRVQGAAKYRLSLSPPEGTFLDVTQPESGSKVNLVLNLTSAQAGLYDWEVVAVDAQMAAGESSPTQSFLFTQIDGEPWDLDESGAADPGDLFQLSQYWHSGLTAGDLTQDGETRAEDAALFVETQNTGVLPTPTPIPGFTAPTQIRPTQGANVSTDSVAFEWQSLIGAIGYEFTLRDENPNSNIVQIVPQPSFGNVLSTIPFLQARPRSWKVRAIFGAGIPGPLSPEISFNVVEQ